MSALVLEGVHLTRGALRAARAPDPQRATASDGEVVLAGVDLDLAEGGFLSLLGESGGGKSSLLRLANRLVEPERGRVEVAGRAVREWPIGELRRTAVVVGQHPALFGGTVAEELRRPLEWAARTASDGELVSALLRAALDVALDRPAEELSGGERTRLAVARGTLLAPRLLLLDEPTGSLDLPTAAQLLERLSAWAKQAGVTLVCVTHRPQDVASLGGQAAVLLNGHLHGPFPAAQFAAGEVEDEAVRAFLGGLAAEPREEGW